MPGGVGSVDVAQVEAAVDNQSADLEVAVDIA